MLQECSHADLHCRNGKIDLLSRTNATCKLYGLLCEVCTCGPKGDTHSTRNGSKILCKGALLLLVECTSPPLPIPIRLQVADCHLHPRVSTARINANVTTGAHKARKRQIITSFPQGIHWQSVMGRLLSEAANANTLWHAQSAGPTCSYLRQYLLGKVHCCC